MRQTRPQSFSQLGLCLLRHLPCSDECSRAMSDAHQPFLLKLSVSSGDRIEIHAQVVGDLTHRGQSYSLLKLAASDERLNFLSNLAIDRPPVSFIDCNVHSR